MALSMALIILFWFLDLNAQSNTFPLNGNVGIGTLAPASNLQVIGISRFGGSQNYGQFSNGGILKFNGSAAYQVKSNQYAFQFESNPNYGLFFNSNDTLYEFRNVAAKAAFAIGADNGNGYFKGGLSIGGLNATPPDAGLFVVGDVGIGTSKPQAKLHVFEGSDVQLTGGGFIVAGELKQGNLAIDQNEIQARNNGSASLLKINDLGGDVNIGTGSLFVKSSNGFVGIGNYSPEVRLHVTNGDDLTLSGGGTIVVGTLNTINLGIDNNEIQGRNNGSASLLKINEFGGDVNIGDGKLIVSGNSNNVGINTPPLAYFDLKIGNSEGSIIGIGSAETLQDAGNYTLSTNGDFRTDLDDEGQLGTSYERWRQLWAMDGTINTSDERDKTNIRDLNYGLKEIMQLRSIRFNWKTKLENGDKIGLIAQELKKVIPEVVRDFDYKKNEATGKDEKIPAAHLGVMYADIIPVLIRAIQEQQSQIEELKAKLESTSAINSGSQNGNISAALISNAKLEQNIPNPLNNTTLIHYYVPANSRNAQLVVNDMNGKPVKHISLSQKGSGSIHIDASTFHAGVYSYALIVDGQLIDAKKMVIAR